MYRDELDALNAIYQEQKRTNELLEKLVSAFAENKPEKEAAPNVVKGRSRGNSGKGS